MTWDNPRPSDCSCVPSDHEECGLCRRARRRFHYGRLTFAERAYDNYVDPAGAYSTDFPAGCSCHINPPCSYCTREAEDAHESV